MLKGFRDFIMRGNLVELAVAFIIATAFAAVVTTFTAVILSLSSQVIGDGVDFTDYNPGMVPVGAFLTATISFLILAAVVYFFVVTPYNRLQSRMAKGEEAAPPSPDIALLTEIRDLLQGQQGTGTGNVHGGGGGLT